MTVFRERMRGWIWRGGVFGANKKKRKKGEEKGENENGKTKETFFNIDARTKKFNFIL